MVEGDVYRSNESETLTSLIPTPLSYSLIQPFYSRGGNVLGRWNHTSAGGSDQWLQVYYSSSRRTDTGALDLESSLDFDYQDHLQLGSRHDIVAGLGYRLTTTDLGAVASYVSFSPQRRADSLFSAFVEDEVRLTDTIWATVGSKLERNSYTGFEFEPSVRLAWLPGARTTVWASAARAIQEPSRFFTGINVNIAQIPLGPGLTGEVWSHGNPDLLATEMRDYELGSRTQLSKSLSLDAATFLSFYRDLPTDEPLPWSFSGPGQVQIPYVYANKARAENYGGELAVNWSVNRRWRIRPSYSLLRVNVHLDPSSQDTSHTEWAGTSPEHILQTGSMLNLPWRLAFDQSVSWQSRLAGANVPAHTRVDARLSRRFGESAEISVVGQSLLQPRFLEFTDSYGTTATEVPRSIYAKLTWTF